MRPTFGTAALSIFIAGLLVYAVILWSMQRRFLKKVDLIFAKHHRDEPSKTSICNALEELNQDSAHFVFTFDRHANISFQQKRVTFLYGHVGIRSAGGIRGPVWTLGKRVFALVDKDGAESINESSSVFRFAMSWNGYSVFLINVDALIAELVHQ